MTLGMICGLIGALLSVVSYTTRSMVPLRTVALASNGCFLIYGIMELQWPSILLNLVAIPLNFIRLQEVRRLVREVEAAQSDAPLSELLLPHMSRRRVKAGQILFQKGDVAHEMFYLHQGRVAIPELGTELEPGTIFGEIGVFAPESRRTQSAVCREDADLYTMTQSDALHLYYQNPKLGFHLMRLIVARLMSDRARQRKAGEAGSE
jgi:CRP-like cAMP-binding protein